jgi:hypothetical protein
MMAKGWSGGCLEWQSYVLWAVWVADESGWFNKFGRVIVAGGMGVVVETFAICLELSKGNTCSWKRT